jgi:DNA-binding response OmpR family regulator
MSQTALLVDSDPVQRASTARLLRSLGYTVIVASTFADARRYLLATESLALLVADVRLGEFNGLHIAFRARAAHPNVSIVITDRAFDATLQAEANRMGGSYLARPFSTNDLEALITPQASSRSQAVRRWPRSRVVSDVRAAVGPSAGRVIDISYGGLCLEFPRDGFETSLPSLLNVELTALGLSLQVHPVWADTASPEAIRCGGEVVAADAGSLSQWRDFVDSQNPN